MHNPDDNTWPIIDHIPQDVPAWRLAERLGSVAPRYHQNVEVKRHDVKRYGVFVGYEYVFVLWGIRTGVKQFEATNINIPNAIFTSETLLESSNNVFLYPAPYSLFYSAVEN